MDARRRLIRTGLGILLILSLGSFMLVLLDEPGPAALNSRTLSQLQQYMTALELVRLEKGTYPVTDGAVCLGDYEDDGCWDKRGTGVQEDPLFNDMLDTYIPLLPSGPMVESEDEPRDGREGYIYQSEAHGRGYEIQYLLIGKSTQCGFGEDLSLMVKEMREEENTLCTITR